MSAKSFFCTAAALLVGTLWSGGAEARPPRIVQRYEGPAAAPTPATRTMNCYYYLSNALPKKRIEEYKRILAQRGVEARQIAVGASLEAYADTLPAGSVVAVYSVAHFGSAEALVQRVVALTARRVALVSVSEPFLNEYLMELSRILSKLDRTFHDL